MKSNAGKQIQVKFKQKVMLVFQLSRQLIDKFKSWHCLVGENSCGYKMKPAINNIPNKKLLALIHSI